LNFRGEWVTTIHAFSGMGHHLKTGSIFSLAWEAESGRLVSALGNLPPVTYAKLRAPEVQRDGALRSHVQFEEQV
jgi:hypothetical protein